MLGASEPQGRPVRLLGRDASHVESYTDAAVKSNTCALPNRWLSDRAKAF